MKKVLSVLGVLLVAALVCLSGPAQSEMYVEGYLGGSFAADAGMNATTFHYPDFLAYENHKIPGHISPSFQGGLKLGYWFVKEGFLGYNYPEWAKYFGFYVDFSYHRLCFSRQRVNALAVDNRPAGIGSAPIPGFVPNEFWSNGQAATLAFMFTARYGFYPDSVVPFGRLQPYIAVGPAILFSRQTPGLTGARYRAELAPPDDWSIRYDRNFGANSSVDIALAVETGLRWMCLKNVSLDVSFKYRWAQPSYSYTYTDTLIGSVEPPTVKSVKLDPTYHLFSFQVGAAYHF